MKKIVAIAMSFVLLIAGAIYALNPGQTYADERSADGVSYAVISSDKTTLTFFRNADDNYSVNETRTLDDPFTDLYGTSYEGKILAKNLEQTANWKWGSVPWGFNTAYNEFITSISVADGQKVAPKSCDSLFGYLYNLETIDLEGLDTSQVTSMSEMFRNTSGPAIIDVSSFDTSNVTTMNSMFLGCSNAKEISGLSSFNTSKVTDMWFMFSYCSSLTDIDLSEFDTSNVTRMGYMFSGCSSLESLSLTSFNTSKVTDMQEMFANCENLITLDISSFDTTQILEASGYSDSTKGSMQGIFDKDERLTYVKLGPNTRFGRTYIATDPGTIK